MNFKNDTILNLIKNTAKSDVYLVGGAVRDEMLGKESFDRDIIVCDECAKDFTLRLNEKLKATFITLDETNNIYRLVLKDKINCIDITNPIENDIELDIKRRDLTINAIAKNIKTDEIIDIVGGISDIKTKKIKMISEKNFTDDPLRLLRVFRFMAISGFALDENTKSAVIKYKDLIKKPAVERVRYELLKLFEGEYAPKALVEMDSCGILEILFPIFLDVKKVPKNSHHHLCLFDHSVEVVRQIQNIFKSSNAEIQSHMLQLDFGGFSRLCHLKFAGFLHDIGKFSTWTIEENGRHRFIKHDEIGAALTHSILKEYKFSKKQIEYIEKMVRWHIYPASVVSPEELNDKIFMRYIRKMGDNSIDTIILSKADRLSAKGPDITEKLIKRNISRLDQLLNYYLKIRERLKPLPKLLSGCEVMEILQIKE